MTKTVPTLTNAAALKKSRVITAAGPSGNVYELRPLNMERHALSGGLPAALRQIALGGSREIDRVLGAGDDEPDEGAPPLSPEDALQEASNQAEILSYLDDVVRALIVSIDWSAADIDDLPPVDYRWAIKVAMGEEDEDGEGRRLWGRDPLSRWATFREFHGCAPDCQSCNGVRDFFSVALLGSVGELAS